MERCWGVKLADMEGIGDTGRGVFDELDDDDELDDESELFDKSFSSMS